MLNSKLMTAEFAVQIMYKVYKKLPKNMKQSVVC